MRCVCYFPLNLIFTNPILAPSDLFTWITYRESDRGRGSYQFEEGALRENVSGAPSLYTSKNHYEFLAGRGMQPIYRRQRMLLSRKEHTSVAALCARKSKFHKRGARGVISRASVYIATTGLATATTEIVMQIKQHAHPPTT